MDLGPYYATLAASDRLRILVEELRWPGPTREILTEPDYGQSLRRITFSRVLRRFL